MLFTLMLGQLRNPLLNQPDPLLPDPLLLVLLVDHRLRLAWLYGCWLAVRLGWLCLSHPSHC